MTFYEHTTDLIAPKRTTETAQSAFKTAVTRAELMGVETAQANPLLPTSASGVSWPKIPIRSFRKRTEKFTHGKSAGNDDPPKKTRHHVDGWNQDVLKILWFKKKDIFVVQAGTYAEDFSVSHSASSDGGSASMEESSPESGRTVSWKKREDSCPPRQIYEEEYGRKL